MGLTTYSLHDAVIWYAAVINIITFILYGHDKHKAKRRAWRTPEKVLLGAAFIGGSVGAVLGMRVFHHKTRHWKFRLGVPLCLLLHCILLIVLTVKGIW